MTLAPIVLAFGAFVLLVAIYGFVVEPGFRLRVVRYRIGPEQWRGRARLRFVVLSDFHAGTPYMPARRISRIVRQANALSGDAILLIGDYLTRRRWWCQPEGPESVANALAPLAAPLGVFAVLGNHDFRNDPRGALPADGPFPRIGELLAEKGFRVLENQAALVDTTGGPFWIAGLGDQRAEKIGRGKYRGRDDLRGTLARIDTGDPVILLAHEPDIHPEVPKRVALTVSGHTHAGQVRLFGWSPITPSRFGNRFAHGHIVEGGRHLVVSGGLGTSLLPLRIGVPPEIVVIDIG